MGRSFVDLGPVDTLIRFNYLRTGQALPARNLTRGSKHDNDATRGDNPILHDQQSLPLSQHILLGNQLSEDELHGQRRQRRQ